MFSAQEAFFQLEKRYQLGTVDVCLEYDTFYVFMIIPIGYTGGSYLGGTVYPAIEKESGKQFFYDITENLDEFLNAKRHTVKGLLDMPSDIFDDQTIKHYGVKGMRWGVRRYQPYPKGYKGDGIEVGDAKKNSVSVEGEPLKYKSPFIRDLKNVSKSMAISMLPGGSAINLMRYAHGVSNKLDRTDYLQSEGAPEKLSKLKRKTKATTTFEDAKLCNPAGMVNKRGRVNNCMYCSVAMDMRRRGYDVQARQRARGGNADQVLNWYKNAKVETVQQRNRKITETRKKYVSECYDNLTKILEHQGNGARGYLSFQWDGTMNGHAIYYEIMNGQAKFFDGQNGKTDLDSYFSFANPKSYTYIRLDTAKPSEQITETVISYYGQKKTEKKRR